MTLEAFESIVEVSHIHRLSEKKNIDLIFYKQIDYVAFKEDVFDRISENSVVVNSPSKRCDGLYIFRFKGYTVCVFNMTTDEQTSGFDIKFH